MLILDFYVVLKFIPLNSIKHLFHPLLWFFLRKKSLMVNLNHLWSGFRRVGVVSTIRQMVYFDLISVSLEFNYGGSDLFAWVFAVKVKSTKNWYRVCDEALDATTVWPTEEHRKWWRWSFHGGEDFRQPRLSFPSWRTHGVSWSFFNWCAEDGVAWTASIGPLLLFCAFLL